jgi:hypothetical protein
MESKRGRIVVVNYEQGGAMPGPEKRGSSVTTVHLPTSDLEWARQRARDLGVSVSWVMRAALKAERMAVEQAAIAAEQAAV